MNQNETRRKHHLWLVRYGRELFPGSIRQDNYCIVLATDPEPAKKQGIAQFNRAGLGLEKEEEQKKVEVESLHTDETKLLRTAIRMLDGIVEDQMAQDLDWVTDQVSQVADFLQFQLEAQRAKVAQGHALKEAQ